jgi:hypothetical protein
MSIFMCYVRIKSFHEKSTSRVAYIKKITLSAKIYVHAKILEIYVLNLFLNF